MFDIQRTMREAYDKARRLLFEASSASDHDDVSRSCKSSHADDASDVVSVTMSFSQTGHRYDCPSTCTCFLVCTLLSLFHCVLY